MNAVVYAILCEGQVVAASTDYDAIFARRANITEAGTCDHPHAIVSGRWLMGTPR